MVKRSMRFGMIKFGVAIILWISSVCPLEAQVSDAPAGSRAPLARVRTDASEYKSQFSSGRRYRLADSLVSLQQAMSAQRDSFSRALRSRELELRQAQEELVRRKEQIRDYESELTDLRGHNLQSSHTNSVLFIINLVVGLLLLVALGWMYLRRRSEPRMGSKGRWNPQPESGQAGFDHRLDRIQKLGSLRDRGLLTEEEFNLQKRQILGE